MCYMELVISHTIYQHAVGLQSGGYHTSPAKQNIRKLEYQHLPGNTNFSPAGIRLKVRNQNNDFHVIKCDLSNK